MRATKSVVPNATQRHVEHDSYGRDFYQQELHLLGLFQYFGQRICELLLSNRPQLLAVYNPALTINSQ